MPYPPNVVLRGALVLALALFLGLTAWLLSRAAYDQGVVYSLDDVYIHMAIAKNLVAHGVWGVTPWETTSASSSPLWVALLAMGYAALGPVNELAMVAAALSGALTLWICYRVLSEAASPSATGLTLWTAAAVLPAVALFASLPALTLQGMEHPLHAALMLIAAAWLARLIATRAALWWPAYFALIAALPLLRYESLWLVMLGAAGLAWRRRWALSAGTLVAGLLPLILFGLWMVAHDNPFLPIPVMTKSVGQAILAEDGPLRMAARFSWHPLQRLWSVPLLLVLVAVAVSIVLARLVQLRLTLMERPALVLLLLFVAGSWIHATFATFGWGARYEAYLIVLGLVALGVWLLQAEERAALAALLPRAPAWPLAIGAVLAALLLYSGGQRLVVANRGVATHEVRDRDLFIAHFLADNYPRRGVVAMNIGAVSWLGEPHLTDVLALGTPDMLRLFMAGRLGPQTVDALARQRGAKIAVVFDDWFEFWTGGPAPWIAVAAMRPGTERPLNYTLYVLDRADVAPLVQRLQAYQSRPGYRISYTLLPQAQ